MCVHCTRTCSDPQTCIYVAAFPCPLCQRIFQVPCASLATCILRSSQPRQPPGDWSGPHHFMMDKRPYVCITVCVSHVHYSCTFLCAVTCGVTEVGKTVTLMYTVPDPADRITWDFIPQQNEEWVLSITFFVMLYFFHPQVNTGSSSVLLSVIDHSQFCK